MDLTFSRASFCCRFLNTSLWKHYREWMRGGLICEEDWYAKRNCVHEVCWWMLMSEKGFCYELETIVMTWKLRGLEVETNEGFVDVSERKGWEGGKLSIDEKTAWRNGCFLNNNNWIYTEVKRLKCSLKLNRFKKKLNRFNSVQVQFKTRYLIPELKHFWTGSKLEQL